MIKAAETTAITTCSSVNNGSILGRSGRFGRWVDGTAYLLGRDVCASAHCA